MRLTTKSEYSLLALIFIARHEDSGFVKIEDICIKYDIPKKYLEHLMMVLKQNGYTKTRRGAGGGYKLSRPAKSISVAEVIRLMDGALAPTDSVSKFFYWETPLQKEKKIIRLLKDIRDYVATTLEKASLADLV
ncbi:MAG: Rrf2 family transcriptional regulator [Candidatus Omnitrophica bacterium]|nr:Rrf2 family transcriptional regulator [Candidatus Omnitrophota bacterium]